MHPDLLEGVKSKIKFCQCKKKFDERTRSHFIEFKIKDKTGSKKSEGGVRTIVESLVKIVNISLHEENKGHDDYIIDDIVMTKSDRIRGLKKKSEKQEVMKESILIRRN